MTRPVAAGPAHAAAMAAIHADSFPPGARWDTASFATLLALPGTLAWIDAAGGLVLARVAADEAEILALAVAPAARQRGLGRALVQAAIAGCAAAGARRLFLEVAADNQVARALYAGLGFAPAGLRRRYYPDGGDAVVLRREMQV